MISWAEIRSWRALTTQFVFAPSKRLWICLLAYRFSVTLLRIDMRYLRMKKLFALLRVIPTLTLFWHSFWHSLWHLFRHVYFLASRHSFWHSTWHLFMTDFLAYILTFYLAYILTQTFFPALCLALNLACPRRGPLWWNGRELAYHLADAPGYDIRFHRI